MVTLSEEISLVMAEEEDLEESIEWYALEICEGFASEDEDVRELLQAIEEHWPDYERADNPYRLSREKRNS